MCMLIGILAIVVAALLISPPALDALWSALARRGRTGGGARNAAFDERLMSGAIVVALAGVVLVIVGLVQSG
jgi:hypothetical protein